MDPVSGRLSACGCWYDPFRGGAGCRSLSVPPFRCCRTLPALHLAGATLGIVETGNCTPRPTRRAATSPSSRAQHHNAAQPPLLPLPAPLGCRKHKPIARAPSMANINWRTINIDALDPDSPANFDLSSLTPTVVPVSTADVQNNAQQIRQLLRGGDNEGALQAALENPPYGADDKGKVRRGTQHHARDGGSRRPGRALAPYTNAHNGEADRFHRSTGTSPRDRHRDSPVHTAVGHVTNTQPHIYCERWHGSIGRADEIRVRLDLDLYWRPSAHSFVFCHECISVLVVLMPD
jgi:hypothetical protein